MGLKEDKSFLFCAIILVFVLFFNVTVNIIFLTQWQEWKNIQQFFSSPLGNQIIMMEGNHGKSEVFFPENLVEVDIEDNLGLADDSGFKATYYTPVYVSAADYQQQHIRKLIKAGHPDK